MSIQRILLVMIAVMGMFGSDAFAIYDTGTGRFMQRDPIGYKDGMNLYTYCSSTPLVKIDPMGLEDRRVWSSNEQRERALCAALKNAKDKNMDLRDFAREYSPTWGDDPYFLRNMEYDTPAYGEVDIDWLFTLLLVHYDGYGADRYWLDPLRGADPGLIYNVAKPAWIIIDGATDPDVPIDFDRFGHDNEENAIRAARDLLNDITDLEDFFGIDCSKFNGDCGESDVSSDVPRRGRDRAPRDRTWGGGRR